MLIIIWIAYYSRIFIFTYCPTQARPCSGVDYYNNPGDALGNNNNLKPQDILANVDGRLLYKRVPRNSTCVPEDNQIVRMPFPQYCEFYTNNIGVEYRDISFNGNIYKPVNGIGPTITTGENCVPNDSIYDKGVPLVQWDSNPPQ